MLVIPDGSIPRRTEADKATTCYGSVRLAPRRRSITSSAQRARASYTTPLHECLDGVAAVLCTSPLRLRHYHPFAAAAIRPRLRLTGTTGASLRCPGLARPRWRTRSVRRSTELLHRAQGTGSGTLGKMPARAAHDPVRTCRHADWVSRDSREPPLKGKTSCDGRMLTAIITLGRPSARLG